MKLLSLFSGIGAFEKALDRLEIPYELVAYCEIDKYASKSYSAIHGVPESLNLGDITKVDEKALPKDIDLITYGFPCQDISLAGKQKGLFNEDGTQTRSGLFFEALRIIEETQPRVAIAENVKNLTGKTFKDQFEIVLDSLEQAGYNNYWQVLNAKDYGIPQNRERVFIVSIRKDIDTGFFRFPEGFPLELRLKDVLEDVVDEKYYISDVALQGFIRHKERNEQKGNGFGFTVKNREEIAPTIRARYYKDGQECLIKEAKCIEAGSLNHYQNDQMNRVYSEEGIAPTILVKSGGGREAKVLVREATKAGYAEAVDGDSINFEQPNSKTRRGRVGHGVAQTLTTSPQQGVVDGERIRKLTPRECFRLFDFNDADFEKAEAVNSNTQLYKQAGNSIVVAVPQYIIKALIEANIFIEKEKEMELKVKAPTFPEVIEFNFDELKQEITERASTYVNLVYGEEQIQDAKKDRATLNKFVKALSDERIKIKKECLKPYEDFEAKIKELDRIVNVAIDNIDSQVKGYEEKQKQEKQIKISEYWCSVDHPEWLYIDMIHNNKWLNVSVSMKSIQDEIDSRLEQIASDLETLANLPEFGFEAVEVYKTTLDLNKALNEGKRLSDIQKRKAEAERLKAEMEAEQARLAAEVEAEKAEVVEMHEVPFQADAMNPPEQPKQWVSFKALLTVDQARELKRFFDDRCIEFEAI